MAIGRTGFEASIDSPLLSSWPVFSSKCIAGQLWPISLSLLPAVFMLALLEFLSLVGKRSLFLGSSWVEVLWTLREFATHPDVEWLRRNYFKEWNIYSFQRHRGAVVGVCKELVKKLHPIHETVHEMCNILYAWTYQAP